jgi:hypothetical protein
MGASLCCQKCDFLSDATRAAGNLRENKIQFAFYMVCSVLVHEFLNRLFGSGFGIANGLEQDTAQETHKVLFDS